MDMRFTRRSEYDNLIGGVINYGSGKLFDVSTDLPSDGIVVTANPALQQSLSSYRGAHGYVFDVVLVKPDGTTMHADRPEPPAPCPTFTPEEAIAARAAKPPEIIHTSATGYELLSESELRDTIAGMGLAMENDADKARLVQIIEKAEKGV